MTSRRTPLSLFLTFLLLLGTFVVPGALSQPVPTAVAAPAEEAPNLRVLKQGYDMLLDRHVQLLDPAGLLNAAYAGVVQELGAAGVAVKSPGPLQLEGNREAAWATYREKLSALLQESPPPADFDVTGASLTAMTRWIDEGHTAYLTRQQYQDFMALLRGDMQYGGIGVRPRRPGITVAEVFDGSPAAKAGIQVGDVIVAVDSDPTDGKTLEAVARGIRGPEGTPVRIDIQRPGTPERLTFTIVRAMVKIDPISTGVIQGDIGYIRMRDFAAPSVAYRFEQWLDSLPSLHARGLVIDLRGNSGGRVDLGTRLLNRFIQSGAIYSEVDRNGNRRVEQAFGRPWANPVPVAILIDEGTASMGEIFASAMRERGVARLIGQKTAGVVAASQIFPLDDGSGMQMAIREIQTGDGVPLNRVGVMPDDVLAPTPEQLDAGRDVQLEAAVIHIWAERDRRTRVAFELTP